MNISHTCCVSLVGFDWGPSPSPLCMNVGLNIHQMLSQKLYPLLSAAHKCRNGAPPAQARGAQPQIEPAACAMQLWIYLGCTPAMSEGVMLCSISVWIEKGSHQANLLHLQHPPAALLLPAGYLLSLSTLGGPHPPLLSSLTVSPELLTCIWRAGWRGGGGRRSGARREVF